MNEQDVILQEIRERVMQMPGREDLVLRDDFNDQVKEVVEAMMTDSDFRRKMQFPGAGDHRLNGSKFQRWGLTTSDIEFLHDWTTALRDYNPHKYTGPSEELDNAFKEISNARYIPEDKIRQLDKDALDKVFPRIPKESFTGRDAQLFAEGKIDRMDAYQRAVRAMDTAETGYGLQLIGAEYVGELWTAARLQSRILGLFMPHEMMAPVTYIPVEADIPAMLYVGENTASDSSDYATSKTGSNRVTLNAKKFVIHQIWSGEMEEDSIIPFIAFLRRQVLLSLAYYGDAMILNGDATSGATGNINKDDGTPAATDYYLAFDAIRHAALVDNAGATGNAMDVAGAITYKALHDAKTLMIDDTYLHHWGSPTNPGDLIYAADPYSSVAVQQLDEIVNQKAERQRALLNGQVADILGHPFIETQALKKTEADGKVSATASNNTKGQIVVFNRRAFTFGWRRRVKMEVERLPGRDQTRMVHSLRAGFGRFSPSGNVSGIEGAAVLYNISL